MKSLHGGYPVLIFRHFRQGFSLAQLQAECQIHDVVNTGRRVCSEHDTTRESPVADRLASATHGKVQEIARSSGPSAKVSFAKPTPACRPGLNATARGGLCLPSPRRRWD